MLFSYMIMVSHDIGTVKAYCDRGLVLHRGKLMAFAGSCLCKAPRPPPKHVDPRNLMLAFCTISGRLTPRSGAFNRHSDGKLASNFVDPTATLLVATNLLGLDAAGLDQPAAPC